MFKEARGLRLIMRLLILALFSVLLSLPSFAQTTNKPADTGTPYDDTRLFYRTEVYGGLYIHTRGWGLNFRKAYRRTGFSKQVLSIEINNQKHPKEHKSFNPYYDDTKGFVFGKLNSIFVLRPSYGRQKVLYTKEAKRGVQISYFTLFGPSLALAKPIYLEIAHPTVPGYDFLTTEKYNEEEHTMDMIFGRAPFTKGLDEIAVYPGLHGKFALNFEYAPADDLLRALETGLTFDAYYKEVPIMAFAENSQFFLTAYLNIQFGKKFF